MHVPTELIVSVGLLVLIALIAALRVRLPLIQQGQRIRQLARSFPRAGAAIPESALGPLGPEPHRSIRALLRAHELGRPYRADDVFRPEALHPAAYNARLDLAMPGILTACGIALTLLGLVQAFSDVDPQQALRSIPPLMAGIRFAFLNSLVGVSLSIFWTFGERTLRHRFAADCDALANAFVRDFPSQPEEHLVLDALAAIRTGTDALATQLVGTLERTSSASGAQLADRLTAGLDGVRAAIDRQAAQFEETLGPRLEQSLRQLVDAPFQQLGSAVGRFEDSVLRSAESQQQILVAINDAAQQLGRAQQSVSATTEAMGRGVAEFERGVQLQRDVQVEVRDTLSGVRDATSAIAAQADRVSSLVEALDVATASIGTAASRFEEIRVATSALTGLKDALDATTERQRQLLLESDAATTRLGDANRALSTSFEAAQELAAQFRSTVAEHERSAQTMAELSKQSVASVEAAAGALAELKTLSEHLGAIGQSVENAAAASRAVNASLESSATSYQEGAAALQESTKQLLALGQTVASESADAMRDEVARATRELGESLVRFSAESASAYEASATRVIDAVAGKTGEMVDHVDERLSDLFDRLGAELGTFESTLGVASDRIAGVLHDTTEDLTAATREFKQSADRLSTASTEALANRLTDYDKALATAVDHFRGALSLWDGKVDSLSEAAASLQLALKTRPASSAGAN